MKKLLALAILSTVSLTEPCFGADSNKGKISFSLSGLVLKGENGLIIVPSIIPAIGYYLTDSIKVTVQYLEFMIGRMALGNLYYYHKIENKNITPYIHAGIGIGVADFFSYHSTILYQIGSGINFPLSSRTSIFAGFQLFGESENSEHRWSPGLEFGINFNL